MQRIIRLLKTRVKGETVDWDELLKVYSSSVDFDDVFIFLAKDEEHKKKIELSNIANFIEKYSKNYIKNSKKGGEKGRSEKGGGRRKSGGGIDLY